MSTLLAIYTPQNGEYLKEVLDAMTALMHSPTYETAKSSFLIFAGIIAAYQFVSGNKVQSLLRYFLTTFFALYCLLGVQVSVTVQDMQQEEKGLTVDNVPIGIALPASIISQFGRAITLTFGDIFRMPDDLDYNKSGMIFGSRTWLSSTSANFNSSPDLSRDVSTFIRQCIFAAKLLGSKQITASELIHSNDLKKLYLSSSKQSPNFKVIFHNGDYKSCREAADDLRTRIDQAVGTELTNLSRLMTNGDKQKFEKSLQAAHKFYKGVSNSAGEIMTQNMLINATRDAASDAFAFNGSDADLMNFTNTGSMQKMHVAEANSFWLASYRLPYYMTVFWMLTIAIFPLVFLISLFPLTQNVYKIYIQSQAYLWSWPPLFIIIHFFVSMAASKTTNLFNEQSGGVSFSNIDSLANIHSYFAYTAGALAASVPFLAYYITKGIASVLSHAAHHFGGMVQSISTSEAQSAAQGNISMASYSGWNMNYDNENAHKFDTNYAYAADKISAQAVNGAMISRMPDGTSVGSVQGAMSQAAVSVHGAERVVDSLNQSAQNAFHSAKSHRVSADNHLQQAISGMSQFNESTSNDTRLGAGVSQTSTSSYNEDIRQMKDAVQQYNSHHDKSEQISLDLALTARASSADQGAGKLAKFFTGLSVEASGTARGGKSWNDNLQNFFNSSEGNAFSSSFSNMVSTAQNEHLDVSDTSNLSASEQVAANISKGASLMSQASSEYSEGLTYQKASTHAKETASSIDKNFNQAFHNYVAEHHGPEGVSHMLGTDSSSIAKQSQYSNEFMNSSVGKSMISQAVSSNLSRARVHDNYEASASALQQETRSNIESGYEENVSSINQKALDGGIVGVSGNTKADAAILREKYQNNSVKASHDKRAQITDRVISRQKQTLSDIHEIQEKQSKN